MPTTNPMQSDAAAAKADLMAVYQTYGRTDELAHDLGGEAYVSARRAELDRIADVFAQCQLLEQPLPDWMEAQVFRFAYPNRGRSVR